MWSFTDPFWETVFRRATICALAFGGIGVISAFVSAWVGYEITDAVQKDTTQRLKDADIKITEATARSDEAKAEAARATERNLELQASNLKLAAEIEPRRIGEADRFLIIPFATQHGKTVRITSYTLDAESAIFAGQISDLLRSAGLSPQDNRMSIGAMGGIGFGVFVSGQDKALADLIFRLLRTLGVTVILADPPPASGMSLSYIGPLADAVVFVGIKPIKN